MRLEIPLKTFLAMYIGGDYKDECVFVPENDHEERITIFDGTEIVTAFWLDLDGKTQKLFVELSLKEEIITKSLIKKNKVEKILDIFYNKFIKAIENLEEENFDIDGIINTFINCFDYEIIYKLKDL